MDEAKTQEELLKLRKRLLDFQRLGVMDPEAFMTYQQTILQLWQEAERRRQACMAQVEGLKRQAAAAESQAHAFSSMSSIFYAVVNGYVEIEEKRFREEAERQAERKAAEADRLVQEKSEESLPGEEKKAEEQVEEVRLEPRPIQKAKPGRPRKVT